MVDIRSRPTSHVEIIGRLEEYFHPLSAKRDVGIGQYRADLVIGDRLAIEVKVYKKHLRKAIGQAAIYRAGGYNAAVATSADLIRQQRNAITGSNLQLFIVGQDRIYHYS